MCDCGDHPPASGDVEPYPSAIKRHDEQRLLSRRQALRCGVGAAAALALGAGIGIGSAFGQTRPASAQVTEASQLKPVIRPRADWAQGLNPTGPIQVEEDVKFLLVHHTASANDYAAEDVAGQIRSFYNFHTGPEKGWPDVAYNFFVDRYGTIWEGREGSLNGPVRGDATGGSQGFGMLCSLIGNGQEAPVTQPQQESLIKLLAWLGATYNIDTNPGVKTEFVSRGSNVWATGSTVTANTISGHRDMSQTTCPGDFVYDTLAIDIPTAVSALRASVTGTADATTSTPATTLAEAPTSLDTTTSSTTTPGSSTSGSQTSTLSNSETAATLGSEGNITPGTDAAGFEIAGAGQTASPAGEGSLTRKLAIGAAAVAGLTGAGAAVAVSKRRNEDTEFR